MKNFKFEYSARDAIFHFKFILFRTFLSFLTPIDCSKGHPLLPGLEIYRSIEYASKNNVKVDYLGSTLGEVNAKSLKLETRMNFFHMLKRYFVDLSKIKTWK